MGRSQVCGKSQRAASSHLASIGRGKNYLNGRNQVTLCLDASYLNDLMLSESSKLPYLELSENLVHEDDWMTTLDLANCYFHVRLNVQDHGKVAFAFPKSSKENEDRYDYYIIKILVYGLKPATLVINILTKPLIDHLIRRAISSKLFDRQHVVIFSHKFDGCRDFSEHINSIHSPARTNPNQHD